MHVCVQHGQKDEDMRKRTDGTKVHVVAMKWEPNAQGQTVNHTSLSEPGQPETWVYSRCARAD